MKTYSFCIQVARKVVDQFEGSGHVPPALRITVVAGPDATPYLDYHVRITGTDIEKFSFAISCDLPDPTSRLPQEEYYTINSSFQSLAFFAPLPAVTAAASKSETSGHSSMMIDETSPGRPTITDTLSELNHFALY